MRRKTRETRAYLLLDAACVVVAWLLAVYLRYGNLPPLPPFTGVNLYPLYTAVMLLVTLGALSGLGAYKGRRHPVAPVVKAVLLTFLISNVFFLYFKDFAFSRLALFYFDGLFFLGAVGWRLAHFLLIDSDWGRVTFRRRAIIVGLGRDADAIYRRISRDSGADYDVIGFAGEVREGSVVTDAERILGSPEKLVDLVRSHAIDEVIVTQDDMPVEAWIRLVGLEFETKPVFRIVPHGVDLFLSRARLEQMDDIPAIRYLIDPLTSWEMMTKRAFDLLVSTAMLLLLSPVLLVTALLIRLESPGGALYIQDRVGRGGKTFRLFKFRSMVQNAEEETGPVWAERNDRRVTRVGGFIRRTGLDEAPQLINVLRGEMSLVGPRPERPFFVKLHPELTQWRLAVRPGLTGLAQIRGRSDLTPGEKVQYDLYYIQNYSLGLDIEILIRTLVMIGREEIARRKRMERHG